VGLHGNMKVQQGYWKWVFGMWKVLKAKYALKKAIVYIFGRLISLGWQRVEQVWKVCDI
jgi:hypothetical protein